MSTIHLTPFPAAHPNSPILNRNSDLGQPSHRSAFPGSGKSLLHPNRKPSLSQKHEVRMF